MKSEEPNETGKHVLVVPPNFQEYFKALDRYMEDFSKRMEEPYDGPSFPMEYKGWAHDVKNASGEK